MSFKAGKDAYIAVDNVAGSLTNLQPYSDSTDWPQDVAMLEVSAFGTAAKAFIPGLTDGGIVSISGPYDVAVHTQITGLIAAQAAGSSTATVMFGPGGSVASQAKISAEAWAKSYAPKSGIGNRADWAATLQITGAVANSTF